MRTSVVPAGFDSLVAENHALRQQVAHLKAELAILKQHPTLAAGIRGEQLFADALNGKLSVANAGHDIRLPGGSILEVKTSALNRPVLKTSSRRWAWAKVMGSSGKKLYDYLLLIGEADDRFRAAYKDPVSPYVFFLVPFNEVATLGNETKGTVGIQLVSNPAKARGVSAPLFQRYEMTLQELQTHFGVSASNNS